MKFSDLLNVDEIKIQNAFLLGLIYSWPIFTDNYSKILAYSSYRPGSRSERGMKNSIDKYYDLHVEKLKSFLGHDFIVDLNSNLKESFSFTREVSDGVSVMIDFDFDVPSDLNKDNYLYGLIEKWLVDAEEKYKKVFLSGVMDGRGSLDFTARYISIDIARRDEPEIVKRKYYKYNDIIGAIFNYNPRLTQENSDKKNDQFRLKMDYYMGHFGLFSPFKIDYYKSEMGDAEEEMKFSYFFVNKKYKDIALDIGSTDRNLKINDLAIKLKNESLSDDEKRVLIEQYKIEFLNDDTEDEILYSSQNVKELAKQSSSYVCEVSADHKTFNSKSNNKNYVEAHHLIPFSERKSFDVSIDVPENIVCLCPNCHRKIHLAVDNERKSLIETLFVSRKDSLEKTGIRFDINELLTFYKVGA